MNFTVILTERCNLNCEYCFEGDKRSGVLSIKYFEDIYKYITNYVNEEWVLNKNDIEININGGEPLLFPDLFMAFVNYFKTRREFKFSLSTNFTLITDEIMDFIVDNNISLQISIDGNKESHDLHRSFYNKKGSFEKVYSNIIKFKQKYPSYGERYSMVCTPGTIRELSSNIEYLLSINVRNIICSFCYDYNWSTEDLQILKLQLENCKDLYLNRYNEGKPFYLSLFDRNIDQFMNGGGKADCGACKDEVTILPNGDVIPCSFFNDSLSLKEHTIGSIFSDNNIQKINEILVSDVTMSTCKTCTLLDRCHHKCFAQNFRSTNDILEGAGQFCFINQNLIILSDNILEILLQSKNGWFLNKYKHVFV